MNRVFRAELFRLNRFKTFWVFLIILAALPLVGVMLSELLLAIFEITGDSISSFGEITVNSLSQSVSYDTLADLFGVICVAIFLSKEFSEGTIRNAILSNKSRTQIYFSYLLIAFMVGVLYKLTTIFSQTLIYGIAWGFGSKSGGDVVSAILVSSVLAMLSTMFIQSLVVLFLFVSHKQYKALVLPLLIQVFGIAAIEIVVTLIDFALNSKGNFNADWKYWIPLYNITFYNASNIDGALVGKIVVWIVPLTVLFVFLGWNKFRKDDLK